MPVEEAHMRDLHSTRLPLLRPFLAAVLLSTAMLLLVFGIVGPVYAGDPTFGTGRNFGTGSDNTRSVAVGDMDNDGDLDLVVGNRGEQSVVYLNDGAGNFLDTRTFGLGTD